MIGLGAQPLPCIEAGKPHGALSHNLFLPPCASLAGAANRANERTGPKEDPIDQMKRLPRLCCAWVRRYERGGGAI